MGYVVRPAGFGFSTELPDMDFETYSEAGYVYDPVARKWAPLQPNKRNGLEIVGASCYSEHPSTEVLSLSFNLKDGRGDRLWAPGDPDPGILFDHILRGGILEAWNCGFEYLIWLNVCAKRMGWPMIHPGQLRDAMAKARAFGLPGALEHSAAALETPLQKMKEGKRLLTKFSKPRSPTKKDPRLRITPAEDPADAALLYAYNVRDIQAETEVSIRCPDLSDTELAVWKTDQRINTRGVHVDTEAAANFETIVARALDRGAQELADLTGGAALKPTQVQAIQKWVNQNGVDTPVLDADTVTNLLKRRDLPAHVRRVLEIRDSLGSASVKKLGAIARTVSLDNRIRDLFSYCGAERTGRWAGRGAQPQNIPGSGPRMWRCSCGRHYGTHRLECPWCGLVAVNAHKVEWGLHAAEDAIEVASARCLELFEFYFGDALAVIAGCLRALFCAAPGHDLICSDYRAIEAAGLAALAGEEWRLEVFRTHGRIYEMSAAKITGVPFEEFLRYKRETGEHHPLRKKVGKVAELASGYRGAVGAWKAFGAEEHFSNDDEILQAVRAWRRESPKIVAFWDGVENAARAAIKSPGTVYSYRTISYCTRDNVLYCRLPSGRLLAYHKPMVTPGYTPWGKQVEQISYMGWNSDDKKGQKAWLRIPTFSGKLTENITQAACRDVLAHALVNVEKAGYPVVLHVHDEIVSEVPKGFGSVEEYERIMGALPDWCRDWPIIAAGGWRGSRYRKD